jgi:hypothetical protein
MKRFLVITLFVVIATSRGAGGPNPPNRAEADRIVVNKTTRTLTLYRAGRPLKTYAVTFGRQPSGAKQREGDDRTPEGLYFIDSRNLHSKYHLALHISYPNTRTLVGLAPAVTLQVATS